MDSHINSQSDDETCWVIHLHAEGRRQRYQLWRIYELCLAKSPDKQRAEKAASLVTSYLQLACREASDDSQSIVNMLTNLSQQMSRLDCRKATGHRRKSTQHVRLKYCSRSGSSIANTTLYYTIQCVYYICNSAQSKNNNQGKVWHRNKANYLISKQKRKNRKQQTERGNINDS